MASNDDPGMPPVFVIVNDSQIQINRTLPKLVRAYSFASVEEAAAFGGYTPQCLRGWFKKNPKRLLMYLIGAGVFKNGINVSFNN